LISTRLQSSDDVSVISQSFPENTLAELQKLFSSLMFYPPSQYFCFPLPFIIRSNFPECQATSVTLLLKHLLYSGLFKILHTHPGKPTTCCAESKIIMTWLLLSMAVCHACSFHNKIGYLAS